MKLLFCDISGFGKISDAHYDFSDGINTIFGGNGYGKSTLATFIKVMLYGFEDESKKSIKDREREKYRPWSRGAYGGSLGFEYEGVKYVVSRTFGSKEADDSFEVREILTNMVTERFLKGSLGTQIFGIDRDSFFRTAYIASEEFNKKDDGITDSIRAKLGNLTEATDDINNYETVCKRIDEKRNAYTPNRKTGLIKSIKTKISEDENKLRNIDTVKKSIETIEEQIRDQLAKIETDKKKIDDLHKEEERSLKANTLRAKKEAYQSILAEYEDSRKSADEQSSVFKVRVPALSEISSVKDKLAKLAHLKEESSEDISQNARWIELNEKYSAGIPKEEEIKNYINLWNENTARKAEILETEKRLDTEIRTYIAEEDARKKEEYEESVKRNDALEKERKKKLTILIIAAAVLIVIGAAILAIGFKNNLLLTIGAAVAGIGLLPIVLIFVLKLNKKKSVILDEVKPLSFEDGLFHVDPLNKKREAISAGKGEEAVVKSQVKNYFDKYNIPFDETKVTESLLQLLDESKEIEGFKFKKEKNEKTRFDCEKIDLEIERFFVDTGVERKAETGAQLDELSERVVKCSQYKEEMSRKKAVLDKYEEENDIDAILAPIPDDIRDVSDIKDDYAELEEECERDKDVLHTFGSGLESKQDELNFLLQLKEEVEDDKEKLAKYERDYELLEKTKEFLEKAKNALALKYTGPTMEGFRKYCAYFDEGKVDDFKIDTNLNLTVTKEGMQRDIKELSLGLKDVCDFCLRLALVNAMYEKEKPFIMLDDPFVNYDASNLEAAKKVMDKYKEECQVLYFTCHESREI